MHAKAPTTERAKKRIEELPITPNGKRVPFPYATRNVIKLDFTNEEINAAIDAAPLKTVPIVGLHAIQHSVKGPRVDEYIDHPHVIPEGQRSPKSKTLVDVPIVIQYHHIRFLWDGNHRTVAMWARGRKEITVRYVNLDADEKV